MCKSLFQSQKLSIFFTSSGPRVYIVHFGQPHKDKKKIPAYIDAAGMAPISVFINQEDAIFGAIFFLFPCSVTFSPCNIIFPRIYSPIVFCKTYIHFYLHSDLIYRYGGSIHSILHNIYPCLPPFRFNLSIRSIWLNMKRICNIPVNAK